MLHADEGMRAFDRRDFMRWTCPKYFSFSEPLPFNRLGYNTSRSCRPAIYDFYLPRFLDSTQNNDVYSKGSLTTRCTRRNYIGNNDDLINYLTMFAEEDSIYTSTLKSPSENLEMYSEEKRSKSFVISPIKKGYERNERSTLNRDLDLKSSCNSSSSFENHHNQNYHRVKTYQPRISNKAINLFDYTHHQNSPYATSHRNILQRRLSGRSTPRRSSVETSSALSSEADSDFIYFSYKSLSPRGMSSAGIHQSDVIEGSKLSKLPSNLEDPDSPFPPYRPDFLEGCSSLEAVSRQFYLEDDDLSDDVFVDDSTFLRDYQSMCDELYRQNSPKFMNENFNTGERKFGTGDKNASCYQTKNVCSHTNPELYHDTTDYINISNSTFNPIPGLLNEKRQSPVIVCEDELFRTSPVDSTVIDQVRDLIIETEVIAPDSPPKNIIENANERSSQSEFEDVGLSGYNLTLANAFDSLRRNSMQTKSRKLWKERRAKMKRSNLFKYKTTTGFPGEHSKTFSGSSSCNLKETKNFDQVSANNDIHNSMVLVPTSHDVDLDRISHRDENEIINLTKPLRGILKNKNAAHQSSPNNCATTVSPTLFNTTINSDILVKGSYSDSSTKHDNLAITTTKTSSRLNSTVIPSCANSTVNGSRVNSTVNGSCVNSLFPRIAADGIKNDNSFENSYLLCESEEIDWISLLRQQHSSPPTYVSVGVQVNLSDGF